MASDPALREALLAVASYCHQPRPLPPCDWPQLIQAGTAHRLGPLLYRALQQSDCPEDIKALARRQAAVASLQFAIQERHSARLLTALEQGGVENITLKGPALARTVYPTPSLRSSGDIDVLVRQEDWLKTHEILLGLGYTCVQSLSAPPPKVAQHKAYYHTQYYNEDGTHFVEIHYDLWWYGLRPARGEQFWERSVPLEIGGARTRMVSPEDMLLHLGIHLHHHGYNRLIWFTDLALLIRNAPALDWTYLVGTARAEGLGIFMHYSLKYLDQLLGVAAPGWVLDALGPGPIQAALHDRLCPPESVLGVEVQDRAVFDFHEVPEATELALNFVLTGRRLEKLQYLGHLLVPSREWLAYYYATDDPALLRRRRLTHVPAMVLKASRELVGAARHGLARQPLS